MDPQTQAIATIIAGIVGSLLQTWVTRSPKIKWLSEATAYWSQCGVAAIAAIGTAAAASALTGKAFDPWTFFVSWAEAFAASSATHLQTRNVHIVP